VLLCASLPAFAAPQFPALTGRVVDAANILDASVEAELDARLAAHETASGDQVVVATVGSLQEYDIRDYGYQLGRHWAIGQKKLNNGVILLVAPNERKVTIEVGYGLEGVFPDAIANLIVTRSIVPRFRAGDFPGGIQAGVSDILTVLTGDAAELEARAKQRPERSEQETGISWIGTLILLAILFLWLRAMAHRARHQPHVILDEMTGMGRRRRVGSAIPPIIFGGGGFGGGGGGFGGGGASGSW
jgi:uncharacterized protein